ncbi:AMP-binding protein [Sphingomonas sp.]|uniref:AMP-binding protein n=1 Tax=Sphingomonas sp. TaxID=28214 RepID=UPI0025E23DAF|nr:AMP-binding protein [Sphingomonas sp.]
MRASHLFGTGEVPLRYQTIGEAFDEAVDRYPNRTALVVRHQGISWTWAELAARVERLAAGFVALGLARGERIGIYAPNCAEWVLTQLASAKAGLILVTVNPACRSSELAHALRLAGVRALVMAERFKTSDYVAILASVADELPELEFTIQIRRPRHAGLIAFDTLAATPVAEARAELAARAAAMTPDDPINIQFTSGTTGAPKGATLTHHNILNNGLFVSRGMALTAFDRICIPVPLYHCFGMVMGVLACVTHGATMVFPAEAFDPEAVLEAVAAEGCTALYGVPTMFIAELAHPRFAEFDLSSLRTGIMAGASCPEETMRQVIERMHMRDVTICYGMTETSPVSFQTRIGSDLRTRTATVGHILPFLEAKLVDGEGRVVPRGETGEFLVRGYSVMRGYWNQAEATATAIDAAGWMHSGDLAVFGEDGTCRIVGRVKDMIIRGGENIYPAEVENFLMSHPDVIEAAVFGMPHPHWGEQVVAWVRTSREIDAEALRAFCRDRIAHYKIPSIVRCVDSFPMTVTGKIQKFEMRRMMAHEAEEVA